MPVENDESTVRRGGMDRRTMIKAAAATGAAAWAAPVILDSVTSPAAAVGSSCTTISFPTTAGALATSTANNTISIDAARHDRTERFHHARGREPRPWGNEQLAVDHRLAEWVRRSLRSPGVPRHQFGHDRPPGQRRVQDRNRFRGRNVRRRRGHRRQLRAEPHHRHHRCGVRLQVRIDHHPIRPDERDEWHADLRQRRRRQLRFDEQPDA